MMIWLDTLGYSLCWGSGRLAGLWAPIWYRYRCPYPIIKDHSARACVAAGHCGCEAAHSGASRFQRQTLIHNTLYRKARPHEIHHHFRAGLCAGFHHCFSDTPIPAAYDHVSSRAFAFTGMAGMDCVWLATWHAPTDGLNQWTSITQPTLTGREQRRLPRLLAGDNAASATATRRAAITLSETWMAGSTSVTTRGSNGKNPAPIRGPFKIQSVAPIAKHAEHRGHSRSRARSVHDYPFQPMLRDA